jgi:hypothetical protein
MSSWDDCLNAMSDELCRSLARERGVREDFYFWLRNQRLLGLYQGAPAFPVHSPSGEVIGCHHRLPSMWLYQWFTQEKNLQVPSPLIIGEADKAGWAFVFESQWDAFAVMSSYGFDYNLDSLKGGCIVITRGAENGKQIAGMLPSHCRLHAFKQNDAPEKYHSLPPADKWLNDVARHAECQVFLVAIPPEYKDPNEWLRAGATGDDFAKAVAAETSVPPPPPEIKNERLEMLPIV